MNDTPEDSPNRIVHLSLDDPALIARNPDVEHERRVAIFDLLEENTNVLIVNEYLINGAYVQRVQIHDMVEYMT